MPQWSVPALPSGVATRATRADDRGSGVLAGRLFAVQGCTGNSFLESTNLAKATINNLPQRPPQHVTGDVGEASAQLVLKAWGWTADPIRSDYGEDLSCTIFVDGQRTNLYFRCQVKGLGREPQEVRKRRDGNFSLQIQRSTCNAWLTSYFPLILIVFDQSCNGLYWTNATRFLKENLPRLAKKHVTIPVSRNSLLVESRDPIVDDVRAFYGRLFRVQSFDLSCMVFPVLMPGYHAIPPDDLYAMSERLKLPDGLTLSNVRGVRKHLPGWLAGIKSLESLYLPGWNLKIGERQAGHFAEQLRALTEQIPPRPPAPDYWVSLVCAPVRFLGAAESPGGLAFRAGQLTDWSSYVNVGGRATIDARYAFALPPGVERPVFRLNTWAEDRFCGSDAMRDVAVEISACESAGPVDFDRARLERQHALGQFVPWACRTEEKLKLIVALQKVHLIFVEINRSEDGSEILGMICLPSFMPGRMSEPARSWAEFEEGPVRQRLGRGEPFWGAIPGRELPAEHGEAVLEAAAPRHRETAQLLIVTEADHIEGMPLNHGERVIRVTRMRDVKIDEPEANRVLAQCEVEMRATSPGPFDVAAGIRTLHILAMSIAELFVEWRPSLYDSSAESLDKHFGTILDSFDKILPRTPGRGMMETTEGILGAVWRLYFPSTNHS